MNQRILGIIPARKGSKRVPNKNIRLLAGKPLITYVIEQALGSKLTRVIVSTDGEQIANISSQAGAGVILRPAALAEDNTPTLPVVQHAITEYERVFGGIDYVMVLQCTAPFTLAEDIDGVIDTLLDCETSVVTICWVSDKEIARLYEIHDGHLEPVEHRRIYRRNGAIYATTRKNIIENNTLYGDRVHPYIMPVERSLDIDTEADFRQAEYMMEARCTSTG